MKRGTISNGFLVCRNGGYCLKYYQKRHVPILIPTEVQVPNMFTNHTGTFDLFRECRRWYNNHNNLHQNTDTRHYNTDRSQQ